MSEKLECPHSLVRVACTKCIAAAEERGRLWKEKEMETLRGAVALANEEIRRLVAAASDSEERGRRRGVEEATARLAVWDDHLRVVGSVHACEQLLEAAKVAYEHLDSFGVVVGGTPREHKSQRRAFDMLRPFVTRGIAPCDSGKVCNCSQRTDQRWERGHDPDCAVMLP